MSVRTRKEPAKAKSAAAADRVFIVRDWARRMPSPCDRERHALHAVDMELCACLVSKNPEASSDMTEVLRRVVCSLFFTGRPDARQRN